MKLRTGFVSNSSSSSFCLLGREYSSAEDMTNALLHKYKKLEDIPGWDENDNYLDPYEFEEATGLETIADGDYEIYVIGRGIGAMDEDETKRQFQERVNKELTEYAGEGDVFWLDGVIQG